MNVKQSLKNLLRDPLNTSVIIMSLAIGMACINPLLLFIKRELTTDNFHKNADRIYLLKCDGTFNQGYKMINCRLGAAEYMKENFAQVEDFCRINRGSAPKIEVNGQTYYDRPSVYEVSANFFNFFTYKLLTNNPNSVLETKDDIAISDELALKYFGNPLPIGEIITIISGKTKIDYVIKGIFTKPAENTQLSFDILNRLCKLYWISYIILINIMNFLLKVLYNFELSLYNFRFNFFTF